MILAAVADTRDFRDRLVALRDKVAEHENTDPVDIVFDRGLTSAYNYAIDGLTKIVEEHS